MTINEIAQAAGVSIATVSRFLNNGPVKEETKKKLEEIILKMNYVPSTFAKEIMNSQSQSIAILTHSMSNFYTTQFVEVVSDSCRQINSQCYTGCCVDSESEYKYLMDVSSKKMTGVILHEPPEGQAQLELYQRVAARLPLVMVHSFPTDVNFNTVTVDQSKGMERAMDYLLAQGYKKIAYISGSKGYSYLTKKEIWQKKLKDAGIEINDTHWLRPDHANFGDGIESTREAVKKYLSDGNRPDAIFTANDIMAMGTLSAFQELNLQTGKDIAIMSHDNTIAAQSLGLTCVDMKIKSLAIAAMDLLEYAMNGKDSTPRHITITPELIIRSSC